MRNEWDYEWDRFRKPETLVIIGVRYSANQHRAWHMLDISYLSVNKCSLRCVFCFAPIPPTEPFLGQHCAVLAAAKGQVLAQFCFWFHALNMEKRSLTISRKTLNDIIIHCSILSPLIVHIGFFGGLDGKESACKARDPSSIPGWGRSPKGMATHSSILVQRIPETEDAGGHYVKGKMVINEPAGWLFLTPPAPAHPLNGQPTPIVSVNSNPPFSLFPSI